MEIRVQENKISPQQQEPCALEKPSSNVQASATGRGGSNQGVRDL